ncbi:cupin [Phycicoccus sp. Root563]|uniref:cupin domain-containing protein n=1 Tax=Phycicoccus sp. Root563 TaxID=1736562 RepID=UPI0007030A5B|nr:cupin domain-containing protein [Phycicoccus sp. Root563]KQZ89952.1 cupin [Phycicoccus sp. Root563]
MSYPPPLYDGETGEVSATVRATDSGPELTYPNGNRVHYLSTGASTGGLFGLYRWEFAPGGSGPGAHFHRTLTESFYILSGEVTIYDGTAWRVTRPGDYLHVPAGGLHGFRNESGAEASMLLHFAPGAPREAYFEGLARVAAGETMTEAERDEFMRHHDNHWVED